MTRRRRRVPRCKYEDDRGRCDRPGLGAPPLCSAHFEFVQHGLEPEEDDQDARDILDELLDHPFARQVRAQLDHLMATLPLGGRPSLSYPFSRAPLSPGQRPQYQGPDRAFASSTDREPHPPRPPPPPPPRAPPPPPESDPRHVLHFGPDDRPTKQEIKKRQRALAAFCHPDKGGSTDAMQRINEAADAMLAQLG